MKKENKREKHKMKKGRGNSGRWKGERKMKEQLTKMKSKYLREWMINKKEKDTNKNIVKKESKQKD